MVLSELEVVGGRHKQLIPCLPLFVSTAMDAISCKRMLHQYQDKLLNHDLSITSFDLIVITSRDRSQTKSYEIQLDSKFGSCPSLRHKFIVIPDPVVKNQTTNEVCD